MNVNKNELSIRLFQLRLEKRLDGTFTEAKDTIANGISTPIQMPTAPIDNDGNVGNDNVDSPYLRQLSTEVVNSGDSPRFTNQLTNNFLLLMLKKIPFYGDLTMTARNFINDGANPVHHNFGFLAQFSAIGGTSVVNTPTLIETLEQRVTPTLLTGNFPITTQQKQQF